MAFVAPILRAGQRRFTIFGRQEFVHFRQHQRQFTFRQRVWDIVLVVDRYRFTPVALATESSIAQAEVDTAFTGVQLLQFLRGPSDGIGHFHALQEAFAADRGVLALVGFLLDIGTFRDRDDGQVEMLRETPVALITAGYGHDGTGAIASEHIVPHPDRHVGAGEGMLGIGTR